jgi:hypothetical protein
MRAHSTARCASISASDDPRPGNAGLPVAVGRGYQGNSFQCPSETTSTVPSLTVMAVWSSIA